MNTACLLLTMGLFLPMTQAAEAQDSPHETHERYDYKRKNSPGVPAETRPLSPQNLGTLQIINMLTQPSTSGQPTEADKLVHSKSDLEQSSASDGVRPRWSSKSWTDEPYLLPPPVSNEELAKENQGHKKVD